MDVVTTTVYRLPLFMASKRTRSPPECYSQEVSGAVLIYRYSHFNSRACADLDPQSSTQSASVVSAGSTLLAEDGPRASREVTAMELECPGVGVASGSQLNVGTCIGAQPELGHPSLWGELQLHVS